MVRLETLRLPRRKLRQPGAWRRLRWLALGLASAAVTVVAMLPAAWIAERVATQTQGRVLLADASGSLWRGSATLALSAGAGSQTATVLPGRLQWTLAFWPLLAGTARAVVTHTEAMAAPVAITATPGGWTVQSGAMRLPASLLEGIGAPFNTLRPDGLMRADWSTLQGSFSGQKGDGSGMRGHVTLRIEQVSSAVSRLRPLGSYRAEIDWSGAGGGKLQLSTIAGPLHLEGSGTLGRQARFEGTAHAEPDAQTQLTSLLSLLGRRDNNVTRLRF
ncbi:type II secretion system protein N [Cupriavidus oxalaticus]|jgi:general secretion pathway protein N|uniref:Type II secretion system protein N n=1 Tax=Cupriavidus oxalaticus TaxID=96344 RepID=A0A375FXZ4_9BURK|nr:type II secretion system protein N [Cupriavidus oxalaticus]QEZ48151.1 type II secretion system protein N [Cupriavidus oxalaticus]QRQ87565.1 type II secretion system protein N [Cupriavidus oxalaticus]QRQ94107.1 type II secretion system protein N [Cupriavidus oxalaticus]WQD82742.1 type II secretion system protein N [Cupriavidus oxalaticus]SPC10646.1 General secretion pathway protein N [Cupriavidus oxalaticus]